MKNAVFIIPYFGKFNSYFQLFLNSCKHNPEFDWLIFTDDKTKYNYPDNVMIHYITFDEIKDMIQKKFDFEINLYHPYKLCDFRTAYGYIFESYIRQYPFWGYCDTDLIWGQLKNFIKQEDYLEYDKIGIFGHGTLIRNKEEICRAFMHPLEGCLNYHDIFTSPNNHSFDEEFSGGINNIFEALHYKIRETEYEANIYTKSSDFRLTEFTARPAVYKVEKRKKAFFCWENGQLFRYGMIDGKLEKKEYLYIHLQARPMQVRISFDARRYKIIPNVFEPIEQETVTYENFYRIKRKQINLHYFKLRWKNLKVKINRRLHHRN